MKHFFQFFNQATLIAILISCFSPIHAQSDGQLLFKYQTVVRDDSGNPMANDSLDLRIAFLETMPDGQPGNLLCAEFQTVTTNDLGIANFFIGNGTPDLSTESTCDLEWNNPYHLQIEIDRHDGNGYQLLGQSRLGYVPYAKYADKTGVDSQLITGMSHNPDGTLSFIFADGSEYITGDISGATGPQGEPGLLVDGNQGQTARHNGTDWEAVSNLFNEGTNIGIGTTTPTELLDVNGKIKTQTLQLMSNAANGYILQSDQFGNATWAPPQVNVSIDPPLVVDSLEIEIIDASQTNDVLFWNGAEWETGPSPVRTDVQNYTNMQPYLGLNYCIALEGLYPSRNDLEPFIGEIALYGFNFAPRGWAKCEGQLLPISSHSALFSLLGTMYGGDGVTTFALPDLRGRVPLHSGAGPGLTPRTQGQPGGSETINVIDKY